MHRQSEPRAGNQQRHTRTRNFSQPTQANHTARGARKQPPNRGAIHAASEDTTHTSIDFSCVCARWVPVAAAAGAVLLCLRLVPWPHRVRCDTCMVSWLDACTAPWLGGCCLRRTQRCWPAPALVGCRFLCVCACGGFLLQFLIAYACLTITSLCDTHQPSRRPVLESVRFVCYCPARWRVGASSGAPGGCPGASVSVVCALRGSLSCPWWVLRPCVSV